MKPNKLNNIYEIDFKAVYQGYLWPSNQTEPIICDGLKTLEQAIADYYEKAKKSVPDFSKTTFIVEGFLKNENVSISIRYADGQYYIQEFSDVKYDEKELTYFHSNRMDGRILKFYQAWQPIPDKYCNGFNVLQPSEYVFVGFKNKED